MKSYHEWKELVQEATVGDVKQQIDALFDRFKFTLKTISQNIPVAQVAPKPPVAKALPVGKPVNKGFDWASIHQYAHTEHDGETVNEDQRKANSSQFFQALDNLKKDIFDIITRAAAKPIDQKAPPVKGGDREAAASVPTKTREKKPDFDQGAAFEKLTASLRANQEDIAKRQAGRQAIRPEDEERILANVETLIPIIKMSNGAVIIKVLGDDGKYKPLKKASVAQSVLRAIQNSGDSRIKIQWGDKEKEINAAALQSTDKIADRIATDLNLEVQPPEAEASPIKVRKLGGGFIDIPHQELVAAADAGDEGYASLGNKYGVSPDGIRRAARGAYVSKGKRNKGSGDIGPRILS